MHQRGEELHGAAREEHHDAARDPLDERDRAPCHALREVACARERRARRITLDRGHRSADRAHSSRKPRRFNARCGHMFDGRLLRTPDDARARRREPREEVPVLTLHETAVEPGGESIKKRGIEQHVACEGPRARASGRALGSRKEASVDRPGRRRPRLRRIVIWGRLKARHDAAGDDVGIEA